MWASIKKNIYTVLVIGLALNFIYASLCHAVSGMNICLMNCCDKSVGSDKGLKETLNKVILIDEMSNCCLYKAGQSAPFLAKSVYNFEADAFNKVLLMPLTERIPPESEGFFISDHRQVLSPSPTVYLINHSFLC